MVQLAHDHPSHIVAPIIHWTKEQVADLFRKELGATEEEVGDVPQMTQFARRKLRAEFLQADLGISGTNFGIAETGSICICTNEGNGRLTTTLPRIHVAMMGIERLVPTMADLGAMLHVLGRSATGQKLTSYTNILTGPRRPGEPDGPEELHVVLVDNGRSKVLASELAEILYCIRCGACLNVCPVYQEIGGHAYATVYPGPVGSVLTPGLRGIAHFHELPQREQPVRGVPRSVSGADRHSADAAGAARDGGEGSAGVGAAVAARGIEGVQMDGAAARAVQARREAGQHLDAADGDGWLAEGASGSARGLDESA